MAGIYSLGAACAGRGGCGHAVDFTVAQAVALTGPDETVLGFARRLRCTACGGRDVRISVAYKGRRGISGTP